MRLSITLKLELNKAHADSYTKNVYYTINKSTGKSIPLSAYFKNSDYKKVISKEILIQMKAEMKKVMALQLQKSVL